MCPTVSKPVGIIMPSGSNASKTYKRLARIKYLKTLNKKYISV